MTPLPTSVQVVGRWGEMIKFSHSIFALPFALIAVFLAGRSAFHAGDTPHVYPRPALLALVVLCMVAARSAAMTFNRIVDADFDARNPRTAERAIPRRRISKGQAVAFFLTCTAIFALACAGFRWLDGNIWPLVLAGPVLAYLCFYSYTKRFTALSHFVLGSAIGLSPAAAWIAIHPTSLGLPAVLLCTAVTLWIGGFDIIYACQDASFDRRVGLHSLPARLGIGTSLWVARAAHIAVVALLIGLVITAELGWLAIAGVVIVAVLLAVENALVRPGDLSRVTTAFFTVNGLISLVLGALVVADVLLDLGPIGTP
jgi:4-hydroxybenzoate polyprenyltransferase